MFCVCSLFWFVCCRAKQSKLHTERTPKVSPRPPPQLELHIFTQLCIHSIKLCDFSLLLSHNKYNKNIFNLVCYTFANNRQQKTK